MSTKNNIFSIENNLHKSTQLININDIGVYRLYFKGTDNFYIEHPAEDQSVPQEMVNDLIKEMNEGKADWQIYTYAYSKHTFTNPESKDYNPTMAKRAWQHTLMFLDEVLKK
jgi:dienelactone hydrolase